MTIGASRSQRRVALLLVAVVAPAAASFGCGVSVHDLGGGLRGSGVRASERRSAGEFDRIEVAGPVDVDARIGGRPALSVTGDDNLLRLVRTEIRDRTLYVDTRRSVRPRAGLRVDLATPALRAISVSGTSQAAVRGFRGGDFRASVTGSADLRGAGEARVIALDVTGSGSASLSGRADRLLVSVSGSGDADLAGVVARAAMVRVSGSGNAAVNAGESLDAAVTGSGDVRYRGAPRVRSRVTGSGSVEAAGAI
jgi:hypothetical protein